MARDKRKDILTATLTLISEHGFHGTPMSKIAEVAEVGAGTIYRYFESKEALINDLYLEIKRKVSMAMLKDLSDGDSTRKKFQTLWRNTFEYCITNPEEMLFLEQYHNSPFLTPETEALTMQYLVPIVSAFESAVEAGEIKNMPFEMLTIFAYDVTVAHAKRHISGALAMDETRLSQAVQASWDAIKRR